MRRAATPGESVQKQKIPPNTSHVHNRPHGSLEVVYEALHLARAAAEDTQIGKSLLNVRQHKKLIASLDAGIKAVAQLDNRISGSSEPHAELEEALTARHIAESKAEATQHQLWEAVAVIETLRQSAAKDNKKLPEAQMPVGEKPPATAGWVSPRGELEEYALEKHKLEAAAASASAELQQLTAAIAQGAEDRTDLMTALDAARAAAQQAQASAQRHQEVVAKVTADNLMFLLRAKSAEAKADNMAAELEKLQKAAAEGRDPWLFKVREDVEQRVGAALQQAADAEAALQQGQEENAARLAAAQAAVANATAAAEAAVQNQQHVEQQMAEMAVRMDRKRVEYEAMQDMRIVDTQRIADLSAECRALDARLAEAGEEARLAKAAVVEAQQEARRLSEQAATAAMDAAAAATKARHSAMEAASQAAVNRQLMQRKQQMEWQLMHALAKDQHAGEGQKELVQNDEEQLLLGPGERFEQESRLDPGNNLGVEIAT